jgi:hypothetical protein
MFSILVKYKQYARIYQHFYGLVRLNQTFGPPEARSFFMCHIGSYQNPDFFQVKFVPLL